MTDTRVLVIGAGVAGLTAASYLAREGFHVRVLEANAKIGGCCGSTEINGFRFNDGAQYLIYPKLLDLVFTQLGFDREKLLPLRRVTASATTHLPNGASVSIGENLSITTSNCSIDVSRAQAELEEARKKWSPVNKIIASDEMMLNPLSVRRLIPKLWRYLPQFSRSLEAELKSLFSDPIFRSTMASQLLYAGAPLRKLPSVSIVALISALMDGTALPIGGMGRIPEALAHALTSHGGEVLLNSRVKNILIEHGRVKGVQTEAHGLIEGEHVIVTTNAMTTYLSLLKESDQPKKLRRKAMKTPLSMSAYCVQLGLTNRIDEKSHVHYNTPMMDELSKFVQPPQDRVDWGYYSIPTVIAPELAPEGGSIVEFVPVIRQEESTNAWNDERIQHLATASIEWLRSRMDIDIAVKRIRSPREFESQLNLYHGAIYGISASQGLTALFPHKTPIEGLYLAGQTTYPGLGVPTAALSGIHAGKILLQEHPLA